MKQFSLEKYLENPNRKVVTRDGREVRIICWDAPNQVSPIYGFIEGDCGITCWKNDGRFSNLTDSIDLFFADEEEELAEFETTMVSFAHAMFDHLLDTTKEIDIKEWKGKLLDLAKKELEKDIEEGAIEFAKSYIEDVNPSFEKVKESDELWKWKMSCLSGINKAYKQGKQDALKDLPKWKKGTPPSATTLYVIRKGYYMTIKEVDELFEILPKEE